MSKIEKTAQEALAQEQLIEISKGSKTINQIREENGLEPIECGDIPTIKL